MGGIRQLRSAPAIGLAAAAAGFWLMACTSSSSPAVMSAAAPFSGGRFVLEINGGTEPCNDFASPQAVTSVYTVLTASNDNSGAWTARSASAFDGTLEIRLMPSDTSEASPAGPAGSPIVGTASGNGNYSWDPSKGAALSPAAFQASQTAIFGNGVAISGVSPNSRFAAGYVTGSMSFSGHGRTVVCSPNGVTWTLNGPF